MSIPGTGPVLVVGSRGLLGEAVVREVAGRGRLALRARVRWGVDARADLAQALDNALEAAGESPVQIAWCAGVGVTATPQEVLDAEYQTLCAFAELLTGLPEATRHRMTMFFASSAGGVYAGSPSEPPFDERSPVGPLAPYGRAKLRAEERLAELTGSGIRVVVGRIANLYGPGQDLTKQQGLISQLALAQHTAQPLGVYVSMDTLRDYIYVDDCAAIVVDVMDRAHRLDPGSPAVTKVLASQRSVSIAALIGEMRRIHRRRPRVVVAPSARALQQARDLRLRSVVWPDLDHRSLTPLVVGMAATGDDISRKLRVSGISRS